MEKKYIKRISIDISDGPEGRLLFRDPERGCRGVRYRVVTPYRKELQPCTVPPGNPSLDNKRPMAHIAHLRKQFKSLYHNVDLEKKKKIIKLMRIFWLFIWRNLNPYHPSMLVRRLIEIGSVVLEKRNFLISSMYFRYFVIFSPWKRAGFFIWINFNPLHPRMLCAKFGWNWPSGSGEEDDNVKSLRQRQQRRQTTDKFWSEKLTWALGSEWAKNVDFFLCWRILFFPKETLLTCVGM